MRVVRATVIVLPCPRGGVAVALGKCAGADEAQSLLIAGGQRAAADEAEYAEVTLELTFAKGVESAAELVWVAGAGTERRYAMLQPGETWVQKTFSGEKWRVRGLQTRFLLLEVVAQPPSVAGAVQKFVVSAPGRASGAW